MPRPACCLLLLTSAIAASPGCKRTVSPDVAATVNGRAITYKEMDKQYKRQFPNQPQGTPLDQTQMQKLELLRVMIDDEIMLQRAEKLGLIATDAEVDARFNEIRAPYTQEEFQKQLDARQMTVDELKSQLRRDMSVEKLFNKEIKSQINITDKDVKDFYEQNKAGFSFAEPQVHLAQLVVTPQADPNVRNLKRDKAQNEEQARKKILMLEARLKQGEDFSMVAQNYSEDPNTAPNGGDLGFIPESALEKADPELRKLILTITPGQVSGPIRTPEGYRILKVISREPAGQKELADPRVQQTIRDTLLTRKDQLLKAAYYEAARNQAEVANFFALSIAPGYAKK
jgi:peptidyl-prolyl cis-trans isomerase SurA